MPRNSTKPRPVFVNGWLPPDCKSKRDEGILASGTGEFVKVESGDSGDLTFYVLHKTEDKWRVLKYFGSGWIND